MSGSAAVYLPVSDERLPSTYARFRELGPVVPLMLPDGVTAWAATTHAAVRAVLEGDGKAFAKHPSHWSALSTGRVPEDWPLLSLILGEHMLFQDGVVHLRLRRLLSKAFTPARVEALRPRIEEIVDELLGQLSAQAAEGTDVDMVAAFAEQLPTAVITEMFGVLDEQRGRIRGWTQVLFAHTSTPEMAQVAHHDLYTYLHELVESKRHEKGDDLTTALVHAHDETGGLSAQELVDSLFLMLVAGHETTVHLLGHALVNLLSNPDQLALAVAGNRWDDVVEETLRLNPPVAGSIFRYAVEDVVVAGVTIPAGDPVLLCLGGAATDPEQHGAGADRFDITREQRGHLAFSYGPHFCLGAPLARLEGRVALSRLFERFPEMTMTASPDDIPYSPSFLTYGPLSVPVSIGIPASG